MLVPRSCARLLTRGVWKFTRWQPPLLAPENEESPFVVGPYIRDRIPDQSIREPRIRYDDVFSDFRNTDNDPRPPIKIILLENIPALGIKGEVLEVDSDRARYQLISSQKAVYASPRNLELLRDLIENSRTSPDAPSSRISLATMLKLEKEFVLVTMNSNNPWTIEPWHIRVAFRNQDIQVPEYAIKLPDTPISGPDMQNQGKDFVVNVTINKNPRETVNIRCTLHHSKLEVHRYWHRLQPRVAVIPEQQKLLDSMFQHEPYYEEEVTEFFG